MPSGLRETSNNHFEIYYEKPWGGVASDSDPVDIAPNQLVQQQGVVPVDNVLCQINLVADPTKFTFVPFLPTSQIYQIFELNGALWAVDQFGYIYGYQVIISPFSFNEQHQTSDAPWAGSGNIPTAVQIVNGVAYIAVYSRQSIYTFDGTTYALGSNYVGGKVFGVLDDYLLQMNVNQNTDGVQPNRVNWSGPGEFTTWDPASNRTAGFNTLAAIEDQITGFLSFASVGLAVTEKGLVEMSPTGVAIGPFSFTVLWTSEVGQGIIFPDSLIQYGQIGYGVTDSGVYSISTGAGFNDISGSARTAILDSFQPMNTSADFIRPVAGNELLYAFNANYPTPFYMVCAILENGASQQVFNVWLMDVKTGIWSYIKYNVDDLVNAQHGTSQTGGLVTQLKINTFDFDPSIFADAQFSNPLTLVYMVVQYATPVTVVMTPYLYKANTTDSTTNTAGPLNLTFRKEEIKLGREPTIRRVLVKAYGNGTLTLSVSGTAFGTIVLDGTTTPKTYYSNQGIYTGEDPQLSITSTAFKGVIIKAMMSGTYADGDID